MGRKGFGHYDSVNALQLAYALLDLLVSLRDGLLVGQKGTPMTHPNPGAVEKHWRRLAARAIDDEEFCTVKFGDLRAVLDYVAELEGALHGCEQLFNEALPKFNWGASALDANAIKLLNDVPCMVAAALTGGEKGGG